MEEKRDKGDAERGGRGKNNGEQERGAWKEQKNRGQKRWTGEVANGRERLWPGLKELQLAGPGGGASSPSLMAVK